VWPHRSAYLAVSVDWQGRAAHPLSFSRTAQARWELLLHLSLLGACPLVLPGAMAQTDSLSNLAQLEGLTVWLAPTSLVHAVRTVAGLTTGPPARTAAALARLPLSPILSAHLRRLPPLDDRQLPLL
jgi:hypothetical protein